MLRFKALLTYAAQLARSLFAPVPDDPDESDAYIYAEEYCTRACSSIGIRHIDPGGIGYDVGYTTLEGLFFPTGNAHKLWPFLDLRAHYFNDGELAANAGLGWRVMPSTSCWALGLNGYIDYRSDGHRSRHFTQVGAGFEILSPCWDFRINGYYPLKDSYTLCHCFFTYPGDYFIDKRRIQHALTGFNAEIAFPLLCCPCYSLYAGIGPYYYGGSDVCRRTWGGAFRFFFDYCNWFTIGANVSYDSIYHTRAQGFIGFRIPVKCCPCRTRREQILSQPVYRNDIIVLDEFCRWDFNY